MTLHAMSDVQAVTVPQEWGGCGQPHEAEPGGAGGRMQLTCPACEKVLLGIPSLGWGTQVAQVRLTPDEIAQAERDEKQAQRVGMQRLAGWTAEAAAQSYGGQQLAEQLAALQATVAQLQAQNVALAAQIAPAPPPAEEEAARPRRGRPPANPQPAA